MIIRQRKWQIKMREKGLCITCGSFSNGKSRCIKCAIKINEYNKKYYKTRTQLNPEKYLKYFKEYREKNRIKLREYNKLKMREYRLNLKK